MVPGPQRWIVVVSRHTEIESNASKNIVKLTDAAASGPKSAGVPPPDLSVPRTRPPSRLRVVLCVLGVLSIVLAADVVVRRPGNQRLTPSASLAPPRAPIPLPGTEIASLAGRFLTESLVDHAVTYDRKECDDSGRCVPVSVANFASSAWRTLAFVGLYQASGREADRVRLMEQLHHELARSNFELGDMVGHHQLFEAYLATGSFEILDHIFSVAGQWLREARATRDLDAEEHLLPMLSCAMSKQMLFAAKVLGEQPAVEYLQAKKLVPKKAQAVADLRNQYLAQGIRFIQLTERHLQKFGVTVLADDPDFKRQSCWVQWAKYAAFVSTGEQQYLDDVVSFFRRARIHTRAASELRFSALQDVLPCVHTLKDIASLDGEFRNDGVFLLQNFILPNWDSAVRPICDGDNGFIADAAMTDRAVSKCSLNAKYTSDAAWAVYVLSFFPQVFEVGR